MWDRITSAIEGSDSKLLRFYLEQEPELIYEQNYHEETLLHHAAKNGDPTTIAELLKCGARADTPDDFGWTPMHEACKSRNEAAVALFIESGISLNLETNRQETPLHIAARHNACAIMARLLEVGAHPDVINKNGNTPLHLAAQKGFARAAEILLTAGANTRIRNVLGLTALHMTAIKGHFRCADALLINQANPHQLDDSGKTFLDIAEVCGKQEYINYIKVLLEELEKQNRAAIPGKVDTLVKKPALTDFYDNQALQPKNQFASCCKRIVNDLISGHGSHSYSSTLARGLESTLWFVVFPLLMFLLWKGFATGALPSIIALNLSVGNLVSAEFMQAFANSLIVFIGSFLMVTTESESISPLHFFKDLREAVHFRVAHLLLIELFFYDKMNVNAAIVKDFAIFWAWFVMLYVLSYLIWWASVHTDTATATGETSEICYAHD
ncbi:MAG: ankyrin repeat domain-containing protein [Candidatus Riflebacteria bacterium]|nr:ankyrin repeat domain-containing protein [Candidatus Riflebacteria bacterium]